MDFLAWLQSSRLGTWVAETLWADPLLETFHALGMAMLIGSLGLINLRVLGYKPQLPLLGTRDLLPLAWIGFTLNAVSGIVLFTSDAIYFFSSYTFRIKIVLIVLGGLNAMLLGHRVFREPGAEVGAPVSGGEEPGVGAGQHAVVAVANSGSADLEAVANAGAAGAGVGAGAKWIAATSLLFWLGAAIAGRLIAYTP